MKTYYIWFESFPDLDRSLKCVLHIENWQPLCWANSISRTIKASAEHSACFVTLENIFMQIFYERCCLLFSQSGSSVKLRAGGCFHKVSSDFFYPLPSLVCTAAVEGYEGKRKKRKVDLVTGENLDTYRTTKWPLNMRQFCLCLWLASSDTGLLSRWHDGVPVWHNTTGKVEKTASRHWVGSWPQCE